MYKNFFKTDKKLTKRQLNKIENDSKDAVGLIQPVIFVKKMINQTKSFAIPNKVTQNYSTVSHTNTSLIHDDDDDDDNELMRSTFTHSYSCQQSQAC